MTIGIGAAMAMAVMPMGVGAQAVTGSAWALPEPEALLSQVIRRIVTQDKPGGLAVSGYSERAFGREETIAAAQAFARRPVVLTPALFADVYEWPLAQAADSLPCLSLVVPTRVQDTMPAPCATVNALWVAITKIERGELPHELHIWYATRFRTDVQGSVQRATYSFCERWLRVGGTWKYDGFVRMTNGVVALPPAR